MNQEQREAHLRKLEKVDEHSAIHNGDRACENVMLALAQLAALQIPLGIDYTPDLDAMREAIIRVHGRIAASHEKFENLH